MTITIKCYFCGTEFTAKRRSRMYCSNTCKTLACREFRKNEEYNRILRKQNEALVSEIKRQEAQQAADEAQRKARFNAEIEALQKYMDEQQKKRELENRAFKAAQDIERQKKLAERKARRQQSDDVTDKWMKFLNSRSLKQL